MFKWSKTVLMGSMAPWDPLWNVLERSRCGVIMTEQCPHQADPIKSKLRDWAPFQHDKVLQHTCANGLKLY